MIAFQLVKKPPLGRNGIKYAISMKVLMIIKLFLLLRNLNIENVKKHNNIINPVIPNSDKISK